MYLRIMRLVKVLCRADHIARTFQLLKHYYDKIAEKTRGEVIEKAQKLNTTKVFYKNNLFFLFQKMYGNQFALISL